MNVSHMGAASGMAPSREANAGQSVDFQYWQTLFDQAQGEGMGASGARPDAAGRERAAEADARPMPGQEPARANGVTQLQARSENTVASARLSGVTPGRMAPPELASRGAASPVPSVQEATAPTSLATQVRGMGVSALAQAEARQHQKAAEARPPSSETQPAIAAHLHQAEDGRWKVAVRGPATLSDADALKAVAQVLSDPVREGGDVSLVRLNGQVIYQSAPAQPGTRASFELDV